MKNDDCERRNLSGGAGSGGGLRTGRREAGLIIQNNVGNRFSPTVIVLAITSQLGKARLPTHVEIPAQGHGLNKDSVALAEQIRTLDKRRLREYLGCLSEEVMKRVDTAIKMSLELR